MARNFIIILIVLSGCVNEMTRTGNFEFLPMPKLVNVDGQSTLLGTDVSSIYYEGDIGDVVLLGSLHDLIIVENKSNADIYCQIDSSSELKQEGYKIEISPSRIDLVAKDKAGLFYGMITIGQLLQDAIDQESYLPVLSIEDYPSLSYRAVHLDMKHHLEKTEYYYHIIDKLASYKVNAIIAEMEDKIAYRKHPVISSDDALSIEEWRKLSNYAAERNIEISPLIQGLGHASFILKHDEYQELRDDPESDWAFNPLDPKTYEVQFDLYRDAIDATPGGKYLHVGGDEVHTTGRNSGKSSLELQLEWLAKVCQFAEDNNRIPIFWDDMPLKHANVYGSMFDSRLSKAQVDSIWTENEHNLEAFLDKFPKNCIYMRWNYSSPTTYGNIRAMKWFTDNGFQVMGATAGQTRWVLMPLNQSNIQNIKDFALLSIENNLNGLLCTLWDDDSPHFELYWRGILAFAEYSWAGDQRDIQSYKKVYRHREFAPEASNPEYAFIDSLEKPVAFWKNSLLTGNHRNQLVKMDDQSTALISLPTDEIGEWSAQYAERIKIARSLTKSLDTISTKIERAKVVAKRNQYRLDLYQSISKMIRFTPAILLALEELDQSNGESDRAIALASIKSAIQRFEADRAELEKLYERTRVLHKPEGYLLDQDHHSHLANQAINFDWQFFAEMLFIEKLEQLFATDNHHN